MSAAAVWDTQHLQFIFFSVDDDSRDLLIHEDEDGDQKSRYKTGQAHPPRVLPKRHDDPATIRPRRLHKHNNTDES